MPQVPPPCQKNLARSLRPRAGARALSSRLAPKRSPPPPVSSLRLPQPLYPPPAPNLDSCFRPQQRSVLFFRGCLLPPLLPQASGGHPPPSTPFTCPRPPPPHHYPFSIKTFSSSSTCLHPQTSGTQTPSTPTMAPGGRRFSLSSPLSSQPQLLMVFLQTLLQTLTPSILEPFILGSSSLNTGYLFPWAAHSRISGSGGGGFRMPRVLGQTCPGSTRVYPAARLCSLTSPP